MNIKIGDKLISRKYKYEYIVLNVRTSLIDSQELAFSIKQITGDKRPLESVNIQYVTINFIKFRFWTISEYRDYTLQNLLNDNQLDLKF